MFRAHVLIVRSSKLHYTASGIITPRGGRLVHRLWVLSQPPDDEHMCYKHVEAWNKLIVKQKFCASSWLLTEINWIHNFHVTWRTFILQRGRSRSVLAAQPRNSCSVHIRGKTFFSISKRPPRLWNTLSEHRQGSPRRWGCQSMKRRSQLHFYVTHLPSTLVNIYLRGLFRK